MSTLYITADGKFERLIDRLLEFFSCTPKHCTDGAKFSARIVMRYRLDATHPQVPYHVNALWQDEEGNPTAPPEGATDGASSSDETVVSFSTGDGPEGSDGLVTFGNAGVATVTAWAKDPAGNIVAEQTHEVELVPGAGVTVSGLSFDMEGITPEEVEE